MTSNDFSPTYFRIGSVQFLNAAPLTWNLKNVAASQDVSIEESLAVPSRLAEDLIAGRYDAALIPIAEAIRHPELRQVSDVCIASEGPVWSIKFVAFRPLGEMNRIGLDPASRSSGALLQICAAEYWKINAEFFPFSIGEALGCGFDASENLDFSLKENREELVEIGQAHDLDGVLLIGDKALRMPHQCEEFAGIYDLGQVWTQWTGLPFVYASWFAHPGADLERLSHLFNEVRSRSQIEMDEVVLSTSRTQNWELELCRDYLVRKIRYRLGGRERRGAEVFCRMMQKYALAPLGTELEFEANR